MKTNHRQYYITTHKATQLITVITMTSLLTLLMAALVTAHPDYSDTWDEYKLTYNKQYSSEEEEVSIRPLSAPLSPSSCLPE